MTVEGPGLRGELKHGYVKCADLKNHEGFKSVCPECDAEKDAEIAALREILQHFATVFKVKPPIDVGEEWMSGMRRMCLDALAQKGGGDGN